METSNTLNVAKSKINFIVLLFVLFFVSDWISMHKLLSSGNEKKYILFTGFYNDNMKRIRDNKNMKKISCLTYKL